MTGTYSFGLPASQQVQLLVTKLAEAENALHAATNGEIDAIINPEGHTILLRETQQALQATNERLRHLLSHSPAVIYSLAIEAGSYRPIFVSDNVVGALGYGAEAVLATSWWREHIHPDDREAAAEALKQVPTTSGCRIEYRLRHQDGTYRWVEDRARAIRDANGRAFEITGILNDISDRRAAEERLRRSEASLSAAQRLAHLGSWEVDLVEPADLGMCPMRWSDELCRILGYEPETAHPSSQRLFAAVHPEDRPRLARAFASLIHEGSAYELNYRIVRPDGTERVVQDRAEYFEGVEGPTMIGTVQDITRRARAEEGRRQSEERFTRMFRSSPAAMTYTDAEGRILDANDRFFSLFGYQREEAIGRTGRELNLWFSNTERDQIVATAHTQGRVADAECQLRSKGGELRTCTVSAEVLRFGAQPMYLWMISDITERKKHEEALRMQSRVLESMSEGVNVTDPNGTIIFSNPAFDTMFGYDRGTLIGKPVALLNALAPKESDALSADIWKHLQRGETWCGEISSARRNGEVFITLARISAVEVLGQSCAVTVREDVTQTKQLQSQLFRAQRMESLGRLAGGIAHDMNNILAPITMAVPLLRTGLAPEAGERLLATIETSAKRGAQLVKQLLFFGRGVEGQRVALRPKDLVGEIEDIVTETFPKNIRISMEVARDASMVRGDPTQLHQVLLNLCVNSRDAMPEGGSLSVVVKNTTITDDTVAQFGPDAQRGPYVHISVVDTGVGIPPENLDKIFDPFFTTKEVGKGTGLGLAMVIGIVKNHGGFLSVRSQPGEGTTFEIHLPAMLMLVDETGDRSPEAPPPGKNQTVLIVDDEPYILSLASEILARHGYTVLTAANGAEGVTTFSRHAAEIELLITDIDMPVMDGGLLIRVLKAHRNDLRVIVSTGMQSAIRRRTESNIAGLGVFAMLPKPYSGQQLLRAVHSAFSTPSDPVVTTM